jgi:hypothetical protein
MTINAWLALRDDAQALIKTRLDWDESQGTYSGPITDRQAKLFGYMHDRDSTQRLFRVDRVSGRDWTIWSVYFDLPGNILQKVKAELDQLIIDYPNHIKIVGAWKWDGTQIPDYPPHPRLIEFMPDVITYENGVEISRTRPTVVSDVNLGLGQTRRDFG